MKYNYRIILTSLLFISAILLSILVPGGPIENREFSHINPLILTSFNIFLTLLGMGSFILVFYVWKGNRRAIKLSLLAALSYIFVYGVDLLGWFPQSPTPMSVPLFWIEVIGLIVAIPLAEFSSMAIRHAQVTEHSSAASIDNKKPFYKVAGLTIIGAAIVIFATFSALHSGT